MIERQHIRLCNAQQGRTALADLWATLKPWLIAGHALSVTVKGDTRSTAQNRILWARLSDLSKQVSWPVDGKSVKLEAEEWKDILSAGLKKTQRVALGLEGGFVFLGTRTSKMTVREMTDLLDLAMAFGDERGVSWSRTSLGAEWGDEVTA